MSDETLGSISTVRFLEDLRNRDVRLTVHDGQLACNAPKGVLTPELHREIKARKPEILVSLRQSPACAEQAKASMESDRICHGSLCIHSCFEEQAARTPSAIAVICGAESLTYRELNIRSNRLANRLRAMGVKPEGLVAICLNRSAGMVVALLAVLKAGGAYLPLDPQFPRERLQFMIEDSKAAIVITTEELLDGLPRTAATLLCLDRDRPSIEHESTVLPTSRTGPGSLAYVMYTSGSTGAPKGVEVEHGAVVNFLASMRSKPGISDRDRLLAVTTLSFDICGLEIFLPLIAGAQVTIAPRSCVADGVALARLLRESGATVMQATPVTWRLLLDSGWEGLPGLKMLCGGEAMPRELANRLLATGGELWNLYGPTETTIWSTVHRVDNRPGAVPIGTPIANTQVYVLDERLQLVPPGAVGELYIGGDGLARGYLRRPETTRERFIADPFRPGRRIYRTGDLVRLLQDGNLEYRGRQDQQIKLRGFRIELGEVEAALERLSGVRQAIVMVREDEPGDRRLTAYVRGSSPVTATVLRETLAARLPEYMVPSVFVFLDAFPLTPNQKVDRNALPAPVRRASTQQELSGNGTEHKVAAIWRSLLRVPEVGSHDNFFALGGHSLLIVQLQSRIRQEFSLELPIAELFQRPTVAQIARVLDRAKKPSSIPVTDATGANNGDANLVDLQIDKANRGLLDILPPPVLDDRCFPEAETTANRADGAAVTAAEVSEAPRTFTETQLLAIWQHVLQLHRIGIRDNFFELGGTPLLAEKLVEQMESVFGTSAADLLLPPTTVEQMAAKLASAGVECKRRSLIAIQPRGNRPPLFLVPGGIGDPLTSTNFTVSLSAEQPVYGLQFVGLDGRRAPLKRVEDIAAHFVSEIRAFQPSGPYHLAGHCLGGVIAFEMAQQLAARGQEVACLVMIDVFHPNSYLFDRPLLSVRDKVAKKLRKLREAGPDEVLAYLRRKIGMLSRRAPWRQRSRRFRVGELNALLWATNINAMRRYEPRPYKGQIVLIVTDGGRLLDTDSRLRWLSLAGPDSECHRLPVANHNDLVEQPWVRILADDLRSTLDAKTLITARPGPNRQDAQPGLAYRD